jgi:hypothetical protein
VLALQRMVIAKMQSPPDNAGFADRQKIYEAKGQEIDREAQAARTLINAIIEDNSTESDNARLGRLDDRIEHVNGDLRRYLGEEYKRLQSLLEAFNFMEARSSLTRSDTFRDEFNHAGAGAQLLRRDDARPADGHHHIGHPDGTGGDPRADVLTVHQHRHHAPGAALAGGHPCGRGRPARRIDRRHHGRRNRPTDDGVQQHG